MNKSDKADHCQWRGLELKGLKSLALVAGPVCYRKRPKIKRISIFEAIDSELREQPLAASEM